MTKRKGQEGDVFQNEKKKDEFLTRIVNKS